MLKSQIKYLQLLIPLSIITAVSINFVSRDTILSFINGRADMRLLLYLVIACWRVMLYPIPVFCK